MIENKKLEFTWKWYLSSFVLFFVNNWSDIVGSGGPGLFMNLVGRYLGTVFIIYCFFIVYRAVTKQLHIGELRDQSNDPDTHQTS